MKQEITKANENFSNLYWLTGLKKSANEIKFYLKYLQVKDGLMASTDGAQIREIKSDIPDGFYSILSRKQSAITLFKEADYESCKFPDYKNILNPAHNVEIDINLDDIDKGFARAIRAMKGNSFNPILYIGIFDNMQFKTITVDPEGSFPAIFTGEDVIAALMPIRIK